MSDTTITKVNSLDELHGWVCDQMAKNEVDILRCGVMAEECYKDSNLPGMAAAQTAQAMGYSRHEAYIEVWEKVTGFDYIKHGDLDKQEPSEN